MSSNPPKPETIHRKSLFGGLETAEEVHRRVVWGKRFCGKCKGKPVVFEGRIFYPLTEAMRDNSLWMQLSLQSNGMPPVVRFTDGLYVRTHTLYACARCVGDVERFLARKPSWVVVERAYGPGPDKPLVQVR